MRRARVVVVNSGNANSCTGERGMLDAQEMCRLAADVAGASADQALVLSTGVIGVFLPMDRLRQGIPSAARRLGRDEPALMSAVRGMMTTDKGPKFDGRTIQLNGRTVQLTGVCKGAAMIGPRMATMLCIVMTDAALTMEGAQQRLVAAVRDSFNCICVEGHTSTNDTVLLLASGAAGNPPLAGGADDEFQRALNDLCVSLARQIPDDGEGSTHLVTIQVRGCRTRDDAVRIARTVAESALVKTAIAGADPNWGRIVSAAGYAGVPFDPRRMELRVNGHLLFQHGTPVPFESAVVSASIRGQRETMIELTFGEGDAGIRFWTSDLTAEYVRLNSDYTT
jgi:glutamate N-acetyltransferase/amino-acid N-acetyltransferase